MFAPPDDLDVRVTAQIDDVERRGGFTDPETVIADGEEQPLFGVPVDGDVVEMVQLRTTTEGRFASVEDPDDVVGANVRTAEQVDSLSALPKISGK